jgi:hypothetical protein
MGTYRQPGLILDKTHEIVNQGIDETVKGLAKSMELNRQNALKQRKEAEKRRIKDRKLQLKSEKEILEARTKTDQMGNVFTGDRQKTPKGQVFALDINTGKAGLTDIKNLKDKNSPYYLGDVNSTDEEIQELADNYVGEGGIEWSMKTDLTFAVDQMAKYPYESPERDYYRSLVKQMTEEMPILTGVINNEAQSSIKAYKFNGEILPNEAGQEGLLLYDGKPNWDLRAKMDRDVAFSTNPGRFTSIMPNDLTGDGTTAIRYTNNGESLDISYKEYKELLEQGGTLMGVTKRKPYTDMVKLVWNENIKAGYGSIKTYDSKAVNQDGSKVTTKQTVTSYEEANKNAKEQISNWIEAGGIENTRGSISGYNYAQNNWQMMGGPNGDQEMRLWTGSDKQKARAKELMWEDTKRQFGKETSITNYGINESEYKEAKLTKPEVAALKIAEEDGITLYPFAAGGSEDEKKAIKKRKLKEINVALGLPEDNVKIDLKDVKNNFSKLNADNNLLAVNLLNSMNASPGTSGKLYYQGLEIADSLPEGADLDATWKKVGASYESIDLLDYPALEKELLNAITASKQYQSVKQSNITPYTDTYDLGSVDKLNEIDFSNPEALRSYYQSNQT